MARAKRAVREAPPPSRPPTLLVDTNILLDVLLDRMPWADDTESLLSAIASKTARGYLASHTVPTVHYIVERARGRTKAATAVGDLLELFEIVSLDRTDFQRALGLGLADYEDAVQVVASLRVGADALVTRNARDFRGAPVSVRSPGEVLALLGISRR